MPDIHLRNRFSQARAFQERNFHCFWEGLGWILAEAFWLWLQRVRRHFCLILWLFLAKKWAAGRCSLQLTLAGQELLNCCSQGGESQFVTPRGQRDTTHDSLPSPASWSCPSLMEEQLKPLLSAPCWVLRLEIALTRSCLSYLFDQFGYWDGEDGSAEGNAGRREKRWGRESLFQVQNGSFAQPAFLEV